MRFMMMLPAPAGGLDKVTAAPSKELVTAMRGYSDEMRKAGVLLASEGLHGTSKGARLRITAGKPVITDGPFAESKEVIAGYWMIRVDSLQQALEWAKRCPLPEGAEMEIRQVYENEDFPAELQTIAGKP
jgi:hypothetical protein